MSAVLQPMGHHADGSSIQKHSAGGGYPYVVQVQELVMQGIGYAEVLHPSGLVLDRFEYPLGDKERRMKAYGDAGDRAAYRAECRATR